MANYKNFIFPVLLSMISFGNSSAQNTSSIADSTATKEITLGEIVVKSTLPQTRVKGDAMQTTISGSTLEKAGNSIDVLKQLPNVTAESEKVEVFGRGAAEVYVNGRKLQDLKELDRIPSESIQSVEVVQNPGARYAANVKAVIRIKLKKAQGEGISINEYADYTYREANTFTNNLDINYRRGNLDITASLWGGTFGGKSHNKNDVVYQVGTDHYSNNSVNHANSRWKGYSPQIQFNYVINDNHSLGAFYKWDDNLSSVFAGEFDMDIFCNDKPTEILRSIFDNDGNAHKHIVNAYYLGKIHGLSIDFNFDAYVSRQREPNANDETSTDLSTGITEHRYVESNSINRNKLFAGKLILGYPVWKGQLNAGVEYTHNTRHNTYDIFSEEHLPIPNDDSRVSENVWSTFVEYSRRFGKVNILVGLRYEHLSNTYTEFGIRKDEQCRNYGDLFPTIHISMPVGKVQLGLSYRKDIDRPSYSSLSSEVLYINRYTIQSGNPFLNPTYTHSLQFTTAYSWMNLTLGYKRIVDDIQMDTRQYSPEDPNISLIHPENKPAFDRLFISTSFAPTIRAWHPRWNATMQWQNFTTLTASGNKKMMNQPLFNLNWSNVIDLPRNFRLNADFWIQSKGDYVNYRIEQARVYMTFGIQREFRLPSQMGNLTLDFRVSDPFKIANDKMISYSSREIHNYNPAKRGYTLTLKWRFNEARSKYRGTGAGDKQKSRM